VGNYEENAVLDEVERDGDILLLADGRRLLVNPDEAAVTSIWAHSAKLTLREGKGEGFDLTVTNEETGDTVAARVADEP
jgi:hypothetical protein